MKLKVTPLGSHLKPADLKLTVRLMQVDDGNDPLGKRTGLVDGQRVQQPTAKDIADYKDLLKKCDPGKLSVIAHHPGVMPCKQDIQNASTDCHIVAHGGGDIPRNRLVTLIASDGKMTEQDKLSLSSEDAEGGIGHGNELKIFKAKSEDEVTWAVLNCHDYTHVDLMQTLLEEKVELLVVSSYNNATRLFREYAISDAHRLFCFIVSLNTASLGGSGVYAPFRSIGESDYASFSAGAELFGSRGPGEFDVEVDLDFAALRRIKAAFSKEGFAALGKAGTETLISPVAPSERIMHTLDHGPRAPIVTESPPVKIDPLPDVYRVAVAQLSPMSDKAYLANKYRFPIGKERYEFERVIDAHLNTLVERCRRAGPAKNGSGRLLDMLVLPEVFAAREYARNKLQAFSEEHDCTIVTGVDYPSLAKVHNANECFVIRPSEDIQVYRKITRSQYDAFAPDGTRMEMQRGETFLRFVENNGSGNGFGILICYDYSHLDLMAKINLKQRQHPLDFVVVTANNPFADLYRSCCIADSHRFYQYIVMCNVSKWGGSGVFGPVRTKGARQTLGEIGKGTEGILISELNLAKLRDERSKPDATVVQDPKDREFMRKPGIYQWGGIEDPD